MSPNTQGALLMVACMSSFTFNDICIKATGGDIPILQILAMRAVLTTIAIYILAQRLRGLKFDISLRDWGWIALRSFCEFGAAIGFFTALFAMKFANVSAILQVLPISVTLGAVIFFRERVGWRRTLAILAGFTGVIIIIRPGPEGFETGAFYAMFAVLMVTVRDLSVRKLSPEVPSLTVTFAASVAILLFSTVASTQVDWQPVDLTDGLLILSSSVFIIGGYVFSVMVMRVGEISFVAPFRYSSLLIALLTGLVFFDEWPTPLTLLGATIVVASGLFMFYRDKAKAVGA
ncbi:DMT family transporter [Chachezhania antarctica]|uniref:DMT family transporter n=1 Tax=Chachezhania antarctica TaxID=2340860 RepID=UPI000EB051B1|nr:DMT family transporter [Chachezhania antarctica]|tara:strand:+ start:3277 stop:4146 length:870 start_codon:yes stop_codon:yes gene_type:complete